MQFSPFPPIRFLLASGLKMRLLLSLFCCLALGSQPGESREQFDEKLILRTHSRGHISAYFNFKTFTPVNIDLPWVSWNSQTNTDLFPLSLLRLLQNNDVQELHLGMVRGKWRYDEWGLPPRDSPAKTQLAVWFNTYLHADRNWQRILSHLSGQFCASLNQIKPHITVNPKFSFRPFVHNHPNVSSLQKYAYHAMLSQEVVCTENLTPWTKLLPCKSQKGLADLLKATKLLDSLFFSLSLDFKYSCSDILNCRETMGIELSQNILVVFSPPNRSSKSNKDKNFGWSLQTLFDLTVSPRSECPLSSSSDIFVQLQPGANLTVKPQAFVHFDKSGNQLISSDSEAAIGKASARKDTFAHYDVKELVKSLEDAPQHQKYINLGVEYPKTFDVSSFSDNRFRDIQVYRNFRGTGLIWAGLTITVVNRLKTPTFLTYLDTIPWYFRMYLHTLKIRVRSVNSENFQSMEPSYVHYQPARNRERPHHLELILEVPPESEIEIDFEFERQFLRWTEYPPDSNHGLYISPATLTFYNIEDLPSNIERFYGTFFDTLHSSNSSVVGQLNERLAGLSRSLPVRIYTDPILVNMPTPDFSMPFNVICFVSTVISIAFGPFFNLTTLQPTVIDENSEKAKKPKAAKRFTPKKIILGLVLLALMSLVIADQMKIISLSQLF